MHYFIQNTSQILKDFLKSINNNFIVDKDNGFIGIELRRSEQELFFIGMEYAEYLAKPNIIKPKLSNIEARFLEDSINDDYNDDCDASECDIY